MRLKSGRRNSFQSVTTSSESGWPASARSFAGVSALDSNSTLANAGVAYIVLKDWSVRGKGEDLRSLFQTFSREFAAIRDARVVCSARP